MNPAGDDCRPRTAPTAEATSGEAADAGRGPPPDRDAAFQHGRTDELETIRRLLVTLAHRINNPLQGILGSAEHLLAGNADPARVAESARNITEEAQRIARFLRTCELVRRVERVRYCGDTEMLRLYD